MAVQLHGKMLPTLPANAKLILFAAFDHHLCGHQSSALCRKGLDQSHRKIPQGAAVRQIVGSARGARCLECQLGNLERIFGDLALADAPALHDRCLGEERRFGRFQFELAPEPQCCGFQMRHDFPDELLMERG